MKGNAKLKKILVKIGEIFPPLRLQSIKFCKEDIGEPKALEMLFLLCKI